MIAMKPKGVNLSSLESGRPGLLNDKGQIAIMHEQYSGKETVATDMLLDFRGGGRALKRC